MIVLPAGVKVHLALGHTDMRNYVERRIMRSPVGLTEVWTGARGCSTPHNFGPSSAAEHGQAFVRWSETSGPKVRCRGGGQRLQFLGGIGPQIGLPALKAGVTEP